MRLLRERGVEDEALAAELCGWSAGSPLALTLAADAARAGGSWDPTRIEDRPELVRGLIRHLASTELDGGNLDVIAVAALARTTTARLLGEVLPDVDAEQAEAWLRSLSFAEHANGGVTLHDIVRKAVRADVRLREPEREKELRRRIADHLHARASRGETRLITDLAELVDNKAIRWGFGAEGTVDYRVDDLRPEDFEAAEARTGRRSGASDVVADRAAAARGGAGVLRRGARPRRRAGRPVHLRDPRTPPRRPPSATRCWPRGWRTRASTSRTAT